MSDAIRDRLALPPVTANPVRPGTQFEVTQLLSSTIGDAVLEEMDSRDGFHRAGNPGYRIEGASETPAQPNAVAAPAQTQPAAPDNPGAKKWLGKYNSEEDATNGYHSLLQLNKQVLERNDELMRQVSQMTTLSASNSAPSVREQVIPDNPVTSAAIDKALSVFQENYNIDPADFKPFVDAVVSTAESRARVVVAQELEAKDAPNRMINDADNYLLAKYPEAKNFIEEVALFVHSDTELQGFIYEGKQKGDLRLPMELAWLKFTNASKMQQETVGRAHAEVSKEVLDAARIDAGFVSTQAAGVHENASVSAAPTREDMQRLISMYHSGYKEPLLRATIGSTLPDSVFGIDS